jgi:hypothetical protein
MTDIALNVEGAFQDEQALREMIATRKVCFDHDPFYVKDGSERLVQIGFQLNLYGAFQDPHQLPIRDEAEHQSILIDLRRLCRVFFQSLDLLKPCEHPEPPAHRIVYSPERGYRAEVCLQIPIFDREHFGAKTGRGIEELLATAECLLAHLGAKRGRWERQTSSIAPGSCEAHAEAAREAQDRGS